jgi:hypothetical protein
VRVAGASLALVLPVACGSPQTASTLRSSDGASLSSPTGVSESAEPPATAGVGDDAGSVGTDDEGTPTTAPSAAPAPTPPAPTPSTTLPDEREISGRVVAGPTCPVEREDSPCPDRPVSGARVDIRGSDYHESTATNSQGRFSADAPSGTYRVTASSPSVFGCSEETVTVVEGRVTHVTVSCDTGIR